MPDAVIARAPDSDASSALSEQASSDVEDGDDGGDSDVEVNQLLVDSLALIENTVGAASTPPPPPVGASHSSVYRNLKLTKSPLAAAPGEKIKRPSKPWTNDEDALLWSLLERRRAGEKGLRNATIFSYFGFRTTARLFHFPQIGRAHV